MNQENRLALAVRAQVAMIRADQAKERAALLERQTRPLTQALEQFMKLHQREPDPEKDAEAIRALVIEFGGGNLNTDVLGAAAEAASETARCEHEAAEAMGVVAAELHPGETVSDWAGVDKETFRKAVEAALNDPDPAPAT